MPMKKVLIFVIGLCLTGVINAQVKEQQSGDKIKWMSFTEAVEKNKTAPKKIFIDVYTHWCGWCKRMDASTFLDSGVVKKMNADYYAVKFDAETKDTILFNDHKFYYLPEFKSNELAIALLNKQMSYPSFVFLDENFSMLTPLSGYQTVEQLNPVLKFFSENIYKSKTWDQYQKDGYQ